MLITLPYNFNIQGTRHAASAPTLSSIIGSYKSAVTRAIRIEQADHSIIWQKRYHDHIIRNEADLNRIREYVIHNPARWSEDTFYDG